MISQLFILAPNGHTIVHKDYRGEVPKEASETFLRKIVEKSETSPIFTAEGVNYICVRKNGLFFLCTTVHNVSPSFVIELLTQLTKVCKDYIGVLSEERSMVTCPPLRLAPSRRAWWLRAPLRVCLSEIPGIWVRSHCLGRHERAACRAT